MGVASCSFALNVSSVWAVGRRGGRQALVKPAADVLQKFYMPGKGHADRLENMT
jgi:hypothetical protein